MRKIITLAVSFVIVAVAWQNVFSAEFVATVGEKEFRVPMPERFITPEFNSIFEEVRKYMNSKEFSKAAAECRRIIENNPGDRDILIVANGNLGVALYMSEDYKDARKAYENMLANIPADDKDFRYFWGNAQFGVARANLGLGMNDEALRVLKKIIKELPDPTGDLHWAANAVRMLKDCYPDEEDQEELLEYLEELWAEYRTKRLGPPIIESVASCRERQGDRENAIKAYQELIDNYPDTPEAEIAQRRIEVNERRLKRSGSNDSFERATEEINDAISQKDYERAIELYRAMAKSFPEQAVEAEVGIARCYLWQNRMTAGLDSLGDTVNAYAKTRDISPALLFRAEIRHYLSMSAFESVKSENPGADKKAILDILLVKSDPYQYRANMEKAIADIERIIDEYPRSKDISAAMRILAISHAELAEFEKAEEVLSRITEADFGVETFSEAQSIRGGIYATQRDYAKAISLYEEVIEKSQNEDQIAYLHKEIGSCYRHQEKLKEAMRHLDLALKTGKHGITDQVHILKAQTLETQGEYEAAFEEYRKVSPHHSQWVAEANLGMASYHIREGRRELASHHLEVARQNARDLTLISRIEEKEKELEDIDE